MPDDHSDVVPLLPIPNRTVKRVCANDSAGSRVKVGHRQANYSENPPQAIEGDFFCPEFDGNFNGSAMRERHVQIRA